ncbi:MAG: S41 family peptidase [candidate division Zixibacteria bacterium]|nr:S41 family peptidase [candidate division Zixibacteria bacterium]
MKQFSLTLVALTTFLLAIIWIVGSGEAVQTQEAEAISLAGTTHINLDGPSEIESEAESQESKETLFREIKKFNQTVYDIKNRYMEDIDTEELINSGIRGMLDNLDRFSVLMEKQSYDRLMESTSGKYEGLGIEIDARDNYIIVVTPFEGAPAYKKGLRSGDVIQKIDGTSTYGMTTSDAAKLMRGEAGSAVNLSIKREGIPELLDFEVDRAIIELKSVNYYGIIENTDIGYVRLSRFAEETSNELVEAINSLKEQNVSGLIFDLRSNGGGLLQQAVATADLFLDEGKLVVYTRGKEADSERRHYSRHPALFADKPMVVLVDEGTASASEIVAGAIQDWDRGVIMGQTTYGKGLVQQIFPLGAEGDVALKLTTAKYYVPSGRCIQKPETQDKPDSPHDLAASADDADSVTTDSMAISEKEMYYTNGGRLVYGGGGINPDIELEEEPYLTPIEINMERQSTFFGFAVKYFAAHPNLSHDFEVTNEMIEEYKDFLKEKEFTYKTAMEVSYEKMKEIIEDEQKDDLFSASMQDLETQIEKEKETDFEKSLPYIKRAIKRELVSKIAGERGVYEEVILKSNPAVQKAVELLQNKEEYGKVLETHHTTSQVPQTDG